jgi:hypothetical protein
MGTRSIIANTVDGITRAIYCHWDGYLDHVGSLLLKHYADTDKRTALVNLGSISSLRERVQPEPGEDHSFDRPAEGVTIAYHRDRGEELQPAEEMPMADFIANPPDHGTEYWYLHDGGQWFVRCRRGGAWHPLDGATEDSIRVTSARAT